MPSEKFESYLEEKRNMPLMADVGLTKYQHIERLGNENVEGLLDANVYLQTKLDGANVTVAHYPEHGVVIASRNHILYKNGMEPHGFNGAIEYILGHPGILRTVKDDDLILRGEWAIQHSIVYRKDVYLQLYVFDVQRKDGTYMDPVIYEPLLTERGIRVVPVLVNVVNPTVEGLLQYTEGPDEFGAPQKEGIVIKRPGFVNKFGRTTWAKLVSADFKQKNKIAFHAAVSDPKEMRFVANVLTHEYILKTVHKVGELRTETPRIQHMPEVLGRVWHDAITEEWWDFMVRDKVKRFDFESAHKMAIQKTRDVALAFYNGIPMAQTT